MNDPSEDELEQLRESAGVTLHRGWQRDNETPVLAAALAADQRAARRCSRLALQRTLPGGQEPARNGWHISGADRPAEAADAAEPVERASAN